MLLNDNFIYRKICDVHLLIPIKRNSISNDVIHINDSAAMIFMLCEKAKDVKSLAYLVCEEFVDVNTEEILPEIEEYIMQLVDEGLLMEVRE